MKKIVYIDMDGVLVDFQSGIDKLSEAQKNEFEDRLDEVPHIFSLMDPMDGAIEAFNLLSEEYDCYILSTSPWENSTALQDKQNWVKKYLKEKAHKRLIFSHHKNLNKGDYLIDDRTKRGADKFEGEHIHFRQPKFQDWQSVLDYLIPECIDVY
jgi:5'-nucleotidase